MNIFEIGKKLNRPFNDIEFIAKYKGIQHVFQFPIHTCVPEYDFHIVLTPIKNGMTKPENAQAEYFDYTYEFNTVC